MRDEDFDAFIVRRHTAGLAFVNGDAGPLNAITGCDGMGVFFDPNGDWVVGTDAVTARFDAAAATFEHGTYEFEALACGAQGGVGYLCGIQRTVARLRGADRDLHLDLRVTEVYQRSEDRWTLVHRHADRLREGEERAARVR